jgi:mannose-6-phosphate isomerase class I
MDVAVSGPQILLATAGMTHLTTADGRLELAPGGAVFVAAGRPATLTGIGTVFRATTPAN